MAGTVTWLFRGVPGRLREDESREGCAESEGATMRLEEVRTGVEDIRDRHEETPEAMHPLSYPSAELLSSRFLVSFFLSPHQPRIHPV